MRFTSLPDATFRFAVADRSRLYTALLYAFGGANDRLVTSLTLEDVRHHLHEVGWREEVEESDLQNALDQLAGWGLLDVGQNHTERYRTARDYERRNLQYSLTRTGEAALDGHVAAVASLMATGALQTAVLDAIAEKLDLLADLAAPSSATPDAGAARRTYVVLQELEGHLDALVSNVKQFNGELQRLLRSDNLDETTFSEVKESTVTYLQEYITGLDKRADRVARALARVRAAGVDGVLRRALDGADRPPHLRTPEHDVEWVTHSSARWSGLDAWFAPIDGSRPRVEDLNAAGRRAILALLQVIERMRAVRRRPSSAEADFRQLARWFAVTPAEADMHRLWRAAFGLHPSRHAHLVHPDPETTPAGVSWAAADAVPVSRTLRESGRTEVFSRTGRVRDVTALRAERAARARAEREEARHALESLRTDGEILLSSLGELPVAGFAHMLRLLGRAVAVPGTGTRTVRSADGRVELTLTPPPDGGRTRLRTDTGALDCPDFAVRIDVVGVTDDAPTPAPVTVGVAR